jgi:hypothetical protein
LQNSAVERFFRGGVERSGRLHSVGSQAQEAVYGHGGEAEGEVAADLQGAVDPHIAAA